MPRIERKRPRRGQGLPSIIASRAGLFLFRFLLRNRALSGGFGFEQLFRCGERLGAFGDRSGEDLAARLGVRLVLRARHVERHRDRELRMERDLHRVEADGLDRRIEQHLVARDVRYRAVEAISAISRVETEP